MYHKWQSYDVWFLRYGEQWTEFFVILDYFLTFYPHKNLKNQNFEKIQKPEYIIILHICTLNDSHMMYGSWNMERDGQNFLLLWIIFFDLLPEQSKFWKNEKTAWRYYHFTRVYHKWQLYDAWFLRYRAWRTELFVTLDHFLPFYHFNNLKNQNFEKLKEKTPRDIILHKCPINGHHMMYGSWNMKRDAQIFVILDRFFPFTPLTTWEIKILKWKKKKKKKKKSLEISFYTCEPKIMII